LLLPAFEDIYSTLSSNGFANFGDLRQSFVKLVDINTKIEKMLGE
jgi:hypothetical protein